jgi:hypothetical protein
MACFGAGRLAYSIDAGVPNRFAGDVAGQLVEIKGDFEALFAGRLAITLSEGVGRGHRFDHMPIILD